MGGIRLRRLLEGWNIARWRPGARGERRNTRGRTMKGGDAKRVSERHMTRESLGALGAIWGWG